MRLIFVRHAEPDYSIDSLTEKGWREAEALAKRVKQWNVKEFYASPLGRARDTAKTAMKETSRTPVILPWLEEFRARVYEPSSGTVKVPWDFMPENWTKDKRYYDKDLWTQAELMNEEVDRAYQTACVELDQLLSDYGYERDGEFYRVRQHSDETIVLFCHMGITGAMLSHLLGIPMPVMMMGFYLAPSSVTVVSSEERMGDAAYFRCQVLGDTRHLKEAGEPVSASGYYADVFQG